DPAASAPKPEAAAPKADAKDNLIIAGRVLDPTGKPFAGAKLYVTVKSAIEVPTKLKDPSTKTHEVKTVNGKTEVYMVHPKFVEVMKKHGLDPGKPVNQNIF